ncbi:Kinesin-like protein kif2a [Blomia tropicalis]|nr:Kinesin-like protein kif2a [Blomia tropicalis]
MSNLVVGISIKIQRTNGQVHLAEVTSVNNDTKTITVEWNEGEEIKGKEVDFEQAFHLNPALVLPKLINNSVNINMTNNKKPGATSMLPVRSTASQPKGSLRMRQMNNRTTIANGNLVTMMEPPPPTIQQTHSYAGHSNGNNSNGNSNSTSVNSTGNNNNNAYARRRSNAVKEVEKIKKQREERRARQAEQKAEKIELMGSTDPSSHSQWEFLNMIRDFRQPLDINPITLNDAVNDQQICVAVRKRPLNKRENARKDIDVITISTKDMVIVHEPRQKVDLTKFLENHRFRFDYAFNENADNELVYKFTAKPLVKTIFEGGMATCFAYGQTGSGKTHTMGGDFQGKTQDSSKGIYALASRDVFAQLRISKMQGEDHNVFASFFEIYSGKVFDLLNGKQKLRVLEDAKSQVQIVGLSERRVESVDEVLKLIQLGNNIRTSGVTSANNHSSRSHAVFQLILKRANGKLKGKFSLIDLAGNERGADTSSANRQTRMEGAEINKSLLALKECIRALGRKGAHLPFRGSKLTQVLRDSFIGENSRTCMIAMISPGFQSCEHTLNTLRYANRVKELGTDNMDMKMTDEEDDIEEVNGDDDVMMRKGNSNEDLYQDFHQHLADLEEEVLDSHKNIYEDMYRWTKEHENLIKLSSEVDYDVDIYTAHLEELINEQVESHERWLKFRERVNNFKTQLREEEIISKKLGS